MKLSSSKIAACELPTLCTALIFTVSLFFIGYSIAAENKSVPDLEGIRVDKPSILNNLVPAGQLESWSARQFNQMKESAIQKNILAPNTHPQLIHLKSIANRLMPYARRWNTRADRWSWEVQLFNSKQINAFCMPGGKIGFFSGILEQLNLNDDEVAVVMGHEMAHALREHSREQIAKNQISGIGAGLVSSFLGLGNIGRTVMDYGVQLTMLKFSRDNENEADLIGMDIAARGGFDPRAGITLWQKMSAAAKNQPPQWLSTHPSGKSRIEEIKKNLGKVLPIYAKATGRTVDQLPVYKTF